MSTAGDLAQTVKEVEAAGGLIYTAKADVRDHQALTAVLGEGTARFGGVDIVLANAGIAPMTLHPVEEEWQDVQVKVAEVSDYLARLPRAMR
jgi:NAD(P)-dependent dehydrogenase (short-subunit alcohol dehydrogenase family)